MSKKVKKGKSETELVDNLTYNVTEKATLELPYNYTFISAIMWIT